MRLTPVLCFTALAAIIAGCDAALSIAGDSEATPAAQGPDAAPSPGAIPERVAGDDYYALGQETLKANLARQPITGRARNVILFVADGMDPTTITAARIFDGQEKGMSGEENVLAMETLPYLALSKTYNTDMQVADSAGTASAMMTGVKTRAGVISIGPEASRGDCAGALAHPVMTAGELARQAGMGLGIVSTARLTHATPATVYAHSADRDWETREDMPPSADDCTDIASQLIDFGPGVDVALGGGRAKFLPADMTDPEYPDETGDRTDGRNLVAEWRDAGGAYVWDSQSFNAADTPPLLGLFEPSHMQYEADRAEDGAGEPSLSEMTAKAIDLLAGDEDGYFLVVEGGRVDHAHHAGNAARALTDVRAFDAAVKTAMEMTDAAETLIVVTADHGHTLTISGYPERGNPILGVVQTPFGEPVRLRDGMPYTTLTYANGPGSVMTGDEAGERPLVTNEDAMDVDYRQQALLPTGSETHGGQDVTIFARGPQAHLFDGTVEQNYIFHVMEYALDLNARADAAGADQ